MNTQLNIIQQLRSKMVGFFAVCMVMGLALSLTPSVSMAQSGGVPTPGKVLINQAKATYDINGQSLTAKSNKVQTTVQQVAAVTITGGSDQTVNPSSTVTFTHTITNNGNGSDAFDVTVNNTTNNGTLTNVRISEIGSNTNPQTNETASLSPGGTTQIVVKADADGTNLSDGDFDEISVKATSQFESGVSASASPQDKGIISTGAVVDVTKKLSQGGGTPSQDIIGGLSNTSNPNNGLVTVSLKYQNNGNSDATSLTITDDLNTNGFTYVGNPQVDGSPVSSPDFDESSGIVTYEAGTLQNGGNNSHTLTFEVKAKEANNSYGDVISNTADYKYDTGAGNTINSTSNTATYTVNTSSSVGTPNGTTIDKGTVAEGSTVNFVNTFKNDGNIPDTYNITYSNNSYPSGASITLYASDGNGNKDGQLGDTNSDNTPDTGPVQPGNEVEVIVEVSFQSGIGGPYSLDKTATSENDPNESATITDKVTSVTAAAVDITNNNPVDGNPSTDGEGINSTGDSNIPVTTTNNSDPGTTTSFTLYVNNTNGPAQDYDLKAGKNSNLDALPSGWSVDFQDGPGNSLTGDNTGNIAAGSEMKIIAVVTIPANAEYSSSQNQDIFFRAKSGSEEDVKHDDVDVNANRSITVVSDQNSTATSGGSVTYSHTLTNTGNVAENDGNNSTIVLSLTNDKSDFTAKVYYDKGTIGTFESGTDPLITTSSSGSAELPSTVGTLNNGDEVKLIVKVEVDNGVNVGTTNTTTLTAGDDGSGQDVDGASVPANVDVSDITSVQAGNLSITKTQRIKTPGNTNSYKQAPLNADPGQVIEYKIKVENTGSSAISNVNVTDDTPATYTKQEDALVITSGSVDNQSEPGSGNTGTIEVTKSSLAANGSFTFTFSVKINEN